MVDATQAPVPEAADQRVLVVENDVHYADLIIKILSVKSGVGEMVAVPSLAKALEQLGAGRFALVFLDLHLGDSRGLATLQELKAKAVDANILVMTSGMEEELGLQALREGADDYLVKGHVSPDALRRIARYSLERRAAALAMKQTRDEMEIQLRHAQKLESIGQLAAGIAHEINTPIQFVGDNCRFLDESFAGLLGLVQELQQVLANRTVADAQLEALRQRLLELDAGYLQEEVPKAIRQSLDGVARVSQIVSAMKDFSHPGTSSRQSVNLNQAIESTLTVSRAAWKYTAEVKTDFSRDLPLVACFPGEFNQVVLNLVVNAAHAIEERRVKTGDAKLGLITLTTRQVGQEVEITIADDGDGIPAHIQSRVFDPFFTTKPVGKGTGQGLSIARAVIVDKHKGRLTLRSEPGAGTVFTISLPLGLPV